MIASGAESWKSPAALEVELCGRRTRADVLATVFHGELAQVVFSWCENETCHSECEALISACKATLGEPATPVVGGPDAKLVRYRTSATYIRMSSIGKVCTIALQDARVIGTLEAAMPAATGD